MSKKWSQQPIDSADGVCEYGVANHEEQDVCEDFDDDESWQESECSEHQQAAEFLCVVFSRIAQNEGRLFSWCDVSVSSMAESFNAEGDLYDTARHLLNNLNGDLNYLATLIEGYRKAERWAKLAVNDYAAQAADEGQDSRIYLEYSVYRGIGGFVMDWAEDFIAELRQDIKLFPNMVELICHESARHLNTLRIKMGLQAFW